MRPTRLDWWIYRLFYWRWNRILRDRKDLRELLRDSLDKWEAVSK